MAKSLPDVHAALMDQLARLNNATPEDLKVEIERSRAMAGVANAINSNAKTMMEITKTQAQLKGLPVKMPDALISGETRG